MDDKRFFGLVTSNQVKKNLEKLFQLLVEPNTIHLKRFNQVKKIFFLNSSQKTNRRFEEHVQFSLALVTYS